MINYSFCIKLLILSLTFLVISACTGTQKNIPNYGESTKNLERVMSKQVLLSNDVEFSGNRTLKGASGFLINYNGGTYAVTARHLLGEEGGIQPSVSVEQLSSDVFKKWEMKPRVPADAAKQTIKLDPKGLDYSDSKGDVILFKTAPGDYDLGVLTPGFNDPTEKDDAYLIGCPYRDTSCKQSKYDLVFEEFDAKQNAYVFSIFAQVDLSGFSGAPIINGKGEVIAVLSGGGTMNGKNIVTAAPIKEIQKIKVS